MRASDSRLGLFPVLATLAVLSSCPPRARAVGNPIPHGTLELIAENPWIAIGHTFHLGLHFQLEKGWHIYWLNPGDSGQPPTVKWELPPGISPGAIEWPAPRRLSTSSIVDFGYEDDVTLVVPVRTENRLAALSQAQLNAEIKVLVCREICIPGATRLSLTLPVKSRVSEPDVRTRDLFAAARKGLPRPAPRNWKFSIADREDSFVLSADLGSQITHAIFFPLAEAQVDNSSRQTLQPQSTGFRLRLRKSDRLLKPIDRLKGVLVLSDKRAYLIDVPISKRDEEGRSQPGSGIHQTQSSKEGP